MAGQAAAAAEAAAAHALFQAMMVSLALYFLFLVTKKMALFFSPQDGTRRCGTKSVAIPEKTSPLNFTPGPLTHEKQADLGISRVEELPMEDGEHDRGPRHTQNQTSTPSRAPTGGVAAVWRSK